MVIVSNHQCIDCKFSVNEQLKSLNRCTHIKKCENIRNKNVLIYHQTINLNIRVNLRKTIIFTML